MNGNTSLSFMLHALAHDDSRERISIGDLLAALGDRALAAMLFVFAVPNVLPVHFADLKRDLPGEIGRIAAFLGCAIAPEQRDAIVELERNLNAAIPTLRGISLRTGCFCNPGAGEAAEQLTEADMQAAMHAEAHPAAARHRLDNQGVAQRLALGRALPTRLALPQAIALGIETGTLFGAALVPAFALFYWFAARFGRKSKERKHERGAMLVTLPELVDELRGHNQRERARELLDKALALDPAGLEPNYFYGEFLLDSGRAAQAVDYLERAMAAAPRHGHYVADIGRREEARALLEKARAAR